MREITPVSLIEFVGFNHLLGVRLVEWSAEHAVLELDIRPELHNRSGTVHGGVVAAMIDAAGSFSGTHTGIAGVARPVLTLSLTTSYVGQASAGVIRATARCREGGRKIFASTIEVTDALGKVIAVGQGTYRRAD